MKRVISIIVFVLASIRIMQAQKSLVYDTIINRGIYTSYYSLQYNTASFVSYRLYKGGGSVKRKGLDFHQSVQGRIFKYARSGYDKGHLAPAADFAHSRSEMAATFDYINCLPQRPSLNRGEWKRDETKVRKWSQRDSLLIECGGLDFDTIKNQVPAIFYKRVISLSSGDTLLNKQYINK